MWKWFSIILLCATPVFAQCGPRGCPVDIGDLPPVQRDVGNYGPVTQEGHLRSVVRIIGIIGPGSTV